jgi:hypothetical protein
MWRAGRAQESRVGGCRPELRARVSNWPLLRPTQCRCERGSEDVALAIFVKSPFKYL